MSDTKYIHVVTFKLNKHRPTEGCRPPRNVQVRILRWLLLVFTHGAVEHHAGPSQLRRKGKNVRDSNKCASRLIRHIYISRISHGASRGIHGPVTRFTDASVNNARRLHDRCVNKIIGDGRTTSVTVVRPLCTLCDVSVTGPRLNSHRAVVEKIELV